LPGVGQYIASAVLVTFFEQDEPLLDATMARVLERIFGRRKLVDIRYDPYLQVLSRRVIAGSQRLKLNWALLDLGALVCKQDRPQCPECPLKQNCKYYSELGLR
jgi:A/G-specific adenine glycosylase